MKTTLLLSLFTLIISGATANANRSVFQQIAEEAAVGNGGAHVKEYNATLSKAAVQAQGKAELEKEYPEGCGPWKVITSRREVIKQVRTTENEVGESSVADKLTTLYKNKEIFAAVAAVSNNEIECSLTWVLIYGTDGSKLEINYDFGD